jgi:hypothetical protein
MFIESFTMTISSPPVKRHPGRIYLALGLGLVALGIIGYVVQIKMHRLSTPWYLPILATGGVVLVSLSLWQKRTVWRILGLVLAVLLAGFEWTFLLATRLPPYSGPVAVGQAFPVFATVRADGMPFTQRDLKDGQNHVLVFFRGRW